MSKVIEPTTDTLGRSLDWLSTPESRAQAAREVEIEMMLGSLWWERQMASERVACGSWCEGCVICRERWVI